MRIPPQVTTNQSVAAIPLPDPWNVARSRPALARQPGAEVRPDRTCQLVKHAATRIITFSHRRLDLRPRGAPP